MPSKEINFSLEFYPSDSKSLEHSLEYYRCLEPNFVSVTSSLKDYANNNNETKYLTQKTKKLGYNTAAHMLCLGRTKQQLEAIADEYWDSGIRHIVALRGDLAPDMQLQASDFSHAAELVAFLKARHDFEITVAGYPEKHPESKSMSADIDYLKQKVAAGADRIITQFFFDPEVFLRFRDRCTAANINIAVVPGLLPITNIKTLQNFAKRCETKIPKPLLELFALHGSTILDQRLLAANVLSNQVTRLIDAGIRDFHFYTLNGVLLVAHCCHFLRSTY